MKKLLIILFALAVLAMLANHFDLAGKLAKLNGPVITTGITPQPQPQPTQTTVRASALTTNPEETVTFTIRPRLSTSTITGNQQKPN
jgi:hypothetical protein